MDRHDLNAAARPHSFGLHNGVVPQQTPGQADQTETVRVAEHRGRRIVIRTTYQVEVDGQPVKLPLVLTHDGLLRCPALPDHQFESAVDLVKALIDRNPEDLEAATVPARPTLASPRRVRSAAARRAEYDDHDLGGGD